MRNILIPVDGSEYSDKAIEAGKEIAKMSGAKVTILNVIPQMWEPVVGEIDYVYVPQDPDVFQKYSTELLEKAKAQFDSLGNTIVTESIYGSPADTIVDYVNAHGIDLVIMGSHGMGALVNRLMTGSVTTKVLHHVDVPVLVIK